MMTKKFLVLFVLASLVGHALVIALTTRIDWAVSPPSEQAQEVITVELRAPPEKAARRPLRRSKERQPAAGSGVFREGTAALQGDTSPYRDYLLQVRRKIEQLWNYPPQAIAAQEEGNAVIRFTIDANGSLSGYDVDDHLGERDPRPGGARRRKGRRPLRPPPRGIQPLPPPHHGNLQLPDG